MRRVRSMLFAGTLVVLACSDTTSTPHSPGERPDFAQCNPELTDCGGGSGGGGTPVDPSPNSPGIWLGVNTGPTRCYSATGVGIGDSDGDRFDQWCEEILAQAFKPLLQFSPYDCNIGMEPRWSVYYFPAYGQARITYLLSYYKDCGKDNGGCAVSHPWVASCNGHQGDSEFIVLDVDYNAATQHWQLVKAFLSAHYGEEPTGAGVVSRGDYSTFTGWGGLTYPTRSRGYPRIWVAHGKHANYRSQSTCNSGAVLGGDDCARHSSQLVEARVLVAGNRNVGGATLGTSSRLINCTVAVGAEASSRTRQECYWTDPRFVGWWNPAPDPVSDANSSSPYSMILLPPTNHIGAPYGNSLIETFCLPKDPTC